ncbi:Cyclin-like domain-containing protein [Plasmodiophora brassicae]
MCTRDMGLTPAPIPRSDGRLRLISMDELDCSPSRADGISAQEETRLRSSACAFIARAGKDLQFKQLAIATACVYLHTFYMRFSFKAYDRYEMAPVCLFLAGKVEEQRRKVKDIAEICHMIRHKKRLSTDVQALKATCDAILDKELLLLSVIEFHFHPAHPYQYCMTVLKKMFQGGAASSGTDSVSPKSGTQTPRLDLSKAVQKEIAQCAWFMINDSLKTTLCLVYRPESIALSCIDAAIRIMNLDREEPIELAPDWFTTLVDTMDVRQCRHIWSVLLQVIELESHVHQEDSRILWDKFRRVVAAASDDRSTRNGCADSHADESIPVPPDAAVTIADDSEKEPGEIQQGDERNAVDDGPSPKKARTE